MNAQAPTTLIGDVPEPFVLLPAQWGSRGEDPHAAERLLWAHVLQDAIGCVQRTPIAFVSGLGVGGEINNRRRKAGLEAAQWFESDELLPGSFVWICELLDLEPSYIRKALAGGVKVVRRPPVNPQHRVGLPRGRRRAR